MESSTSTIIEQLVSTSENHLSGIHQSNITGMSAEYTYLTHRYSYVGFSPHDHACQLHVVCIPFALRDPDTAPSSTEKKEEGPGGGFQGSPMRGWELHAPMHVRLYRDMRAIDEDPIRNLCLRVYLSIQPSVFRWYPYIPVPRFLCRSPYAGSKVV